MGLEYCVAIKLIKKCQQAVKALNMQDIIFCRIQSEISIAVWSILLDLCLSILAWQHQHEYKYLPSYW